MPKNNGVPAVESLKTRFKMPVSEMAVQKIEHLITSGELPPESSLPPQREFARQLGVSRASLREALSVLETLGLLRVEARRGVFVNSERPSKPDTAWRFGNQYSERDVFELRFSIEGTAAQLTAMSDDGEVTAELLSHVEKMKTAGRDGRPEEFAMSDFDFHHTLMRSTQNRLLLDLHLALRPLLAESQRLALYKPAEFWEPVKEHERIVEAIRHRDPEGAAYLMRLHLTRAADRGSIKLRT